MARSRWMWPSPIGLERRARAAAGPRRWPRRSAVARSPRQGCEADGALQDEVADEPVHLDGLAPGEAVAAALEGHQARPRDRRDHLLRVPVGHDPVPRAVQDQGGRVTWPGGRGRLPSWSPAQHLDQDLGRRPRRPRRRPSSMPFSECGSGTAGVKKRRRQPVEVVADHRGDLLLEGLGTARRYWSSAGSGARPLGMLGRVPDGEHVAAGVADQRERRPGRLVEHRARSP